MAGESLRKFRRERRVLARVRRAAGGVAAGASRARAGLGPGCRPARDGLVRKVADAAGLSPTRVHQRTKDADLDALDPALGLLRAAGWYNGPAANLRPEGDVSDTCAVPIRLPRVAAILRRITFDVGQCR